MALLCAEASRGPTQQTPDCLPAGADLDLALERLDKALKRLDPQRSTITLTRQFGLPPTSVAEP